MNVEEPQVVHTPSREELLVLDPEYPEPEAARVLGRPENRHLLDYVASDPFGSHVFPGDRPCTTDQFFDDLDRELGDGRPYFLWATIPLCRYHCKFCQFPIVIQPKNSDSAGAAARRWVDGHLVEAQLWLGRVPRLRTTPVGEFCFFGGTPTSLPAEELDRLLRFYQDNFGFTPETTIRVEGSPDTLSPDKLALLRRRGCRKLTFGIQSFDRRLLEAAGRDHTPEQARQAVRAARAAGFTRIDGDLIYGLLDQTVASFEADVREMIALGFDCVVATKLHLRPFGETNTAIAGVRAPWQNAHHRARLAEQGHRWPPLGEQYQMRELAVGLLAEAGMEESPTMYFQAASVGCGTWKSLVLDQDKQRPEVGIGLGGSSSTARASAHITTAPVRYFAALERGVLPLEEPRALDRAGQIASSLRRAISTCRPLSEDEHRRRFPESALLEGRWGSIFRGLQARGLATFKPDPGSIELTPVGKTLVEAIANTEIVP